MGRKIIFLNATQKIYEFVQKNAPKESVHPSNLNIKIPKSYFEEKEWNFLVEDENKFKTYININGADVWLPIYEIKENILYTNKITVSLIQTKHSELS